jgi:hypothetical protein
MRTRSFLTFALLTMNKTSKSEPFGRRNNNDKDSKESKEFDFIASFKELYTDYKINDSSKQIVDIFKSGLPHQVYCIYFNLIY